MLGPLRVSRRGEDVSLPNSRKTRALLAYLAVTRRAERRDHLCELFWEVPEDPRGALRWSLSKLRRLVDLPDQPAIVADRETVRLDLPVTAIDFHRLKALVHAGVASAEIQALRRAVAQAGVFLEGLELPDCDAFNAWCIGQREDVRQWRVAVLDELTSRDIEADEAVDLARSWTMLDPYSVTGWERLIELLDRSGRSQEADQQKSLAIRVLTEAAVDIPPSLRPSNAIPAPVVSDRQTAGVKIEQNVRFCRSADGTRIAYTRIGDGPPLVRAGYWLNDLHRDLASPIWRPWMEAVLESGRSLVLYDARGLGMSDRDADQSIDHFVDDLQAVVEAAGLESFDLYGMAQGSVTAITYAARCPQRVSRLVLQSSYATGWMLRNDPTEIERRKATITLASSGWGQNNKALISMFLGLYLPKADDQQCQWFEKFLQSMLLHPGIGELQQVLGYADVQSYAEQVTAPTLVVHPRGEIIIPLAAGREVASLIANADLLTLDSSSHLIVPGDAAWTTLHQALDDFLR